MFPSSQCGQDNMDVVLIFCWMESVFFCEFLYGFGGFGSAAVMDSKVMQ